MRESDFVNRETFNQGLKNRYILMRHGESIANAQRIIVSKPENGISGYGLTEPGVMQVKAAVMVAKEYGLDPSCKLYSSPFLRCIQTAEEIARGLSIEELILSSELRERDFGVFEGTVKDNYRQVYLWDMLFPGHKIHNGESTDDVARRAVGLIERIETRYRNNKIILVTHADVGEILQTVMNGKPSYVHRQLPKLRNAELRELVIGGYE